MARIVAGIFLAVFFVRSGGLVLHEPLIGRANNCDMIRVQGCIDAYPVRDAQIPPESHRWQAPIPRYEFRNDLAPGGFVSTESLPTLAMLPAMRLVSRETGWAVRRREAGWLEPWAPAIPIRAAQSAFAVAVLANSWRSHWSIMRFS